MKRLLLLSGILSWFNLIVWGFLVVMGLIMTMVFMNIGMLVVVFIISSIVLHSYAALQLRKSIRDPAIPLGSQTPVGIRLMGAFALFLGILYMGQGWAMLQNSNEIAKSLQDSLMDQFPDKMKNINTRVIAREIGVISLVVGIAATANAILNFRMLRWYLFMRDNIDG